MNVQASDKFNENYRFILSVIDIFWKYLELIPLKKKSGPSVASSFRSIFDERKYSTGRRPMWVRTDKGKEFVNKHFQDMIQSKGIQYQEYRNPDLKCAFVERVHRTIRYSLY